MRVLFTALLFCCGRLFADPQALYLSWYDDPRTTMAIQWHTPLKETSDTVSFQRSGQKWKKQIGSHLKLGERCVHKVSLENLLPDTEYFFKIGQDSRIYKFRTAPDDLSRPIRFCVGGDLYHTPELFRKMCEKVRKKDPLFTVLGGDIAYAIRKNPAKMRGKPLEQWFSFLKEWKEEMTLADGRIIPCLIVPGNHDIKRDKPEYFFELFAFPKKKLYRAIDFGNYLSLILLDTDCYATVEGKQSRWLNRTLKSRSKRPYCFPIYHVAAYPSYYSFDRKVPRDITESCV